MLLLYTVCTFRKRVSVKQNPTPEIIVFSDFFIMYRSKVHYVSETGSVAAFGLDSSKSTVNM
jgi:hypothetical protein